MNGSVLPDHPREPGVVVIDSGCFFVEGERLHLFVANYRQPVSMAFIREQIWMIRSVRLETAFPMSSTRSQTLQTVRRKISLSPC